MTHNASSFQVFFMKNSLYLIDTVSFISTYFLSRSTTFTAARIINTKTRKDNIQMMMIRVVYPLLNSHFLYEYRYIYIGFLLTTQFSY